MARRNRHKTVSLAQDPRTTLPDTPAARYGLVVDDMAKDKGRTKRARRRPRYEEMYSRGLLTHRQYLAAEAYTIAQEAAQESGASGVTEKVDRSVNPSAAVAAQIDRLSRAYIPGCGWNRAEATAMIWFLGVGGTAAQRHPKNRAKQTALTNSLRSALDKLAGALGW